MKPTFVAILLCTLLVVDSIHAFSRRDPATGRVIYGTDNRVDEYTVTDNNVLSVGSRTVALIPKASLSKQGTSYVVTDTTLLKDIGVYVPPGVAAPMCSDVRFANQPIPAICSGFLIDTDKIATAGHCSEDLEACDSVYFVFGFAVTSENVPKVVFPEADVYTCKSFKKVLDGFVDFAVVTTDRPVAGRTPLTVDPTYPQEGESIHIIGHPTGLPRKYADGANIYYTFPEDNTLYWTYIADLDTFGGNSGSAVFHSGTNQVAGILVRGATDYVKDTGRTCAVPNVCPVLDVQSDYCSGEQMTISKAITPFIPVTCANEAQCSNNGVCQSGQCKCNTGFYGTDCSFQCSRNICSNHGECVGLWECKCDSGYKGDICFEKGSANGIRPASLLLALVGVIAALFVSF